MTRVHLLAAALVLAVAGVPAHAAAHDRPAGRVDDAGDRPVGGASVTITDPTRGRSVTVYTDALGRFMFPDVRRGRYDLTVRHPEYRELRQTAVRVGPATALPLRVLRALDPDARAAALPANRWAMLLLDRLSSDAHRAEVIRQCTRCHQLGGPATRMPRSDAAWSKILTLMARLGAPVSADVAPTLIAAARATGEPDAAARVLARIVPAPHPDPATVVTAWEVRTPGTTLRGVAPHPDGRLYAVDVAHDRLHRLDPIRGTLAVFDVPRGGAPLGGVFADTHPRLPANADAHVAPSDLRVAPDGALWATLALGGALARFDPARETWTVHANVPGRYPDALRIDRAGRVWYTLALSNQLGMLDPTTGAHRTIDLPGYSWTQTLGRRLLPRAGQDGHATLPGPPIGVDVGQPIPGDLEIAPDDAVWFSQTNAGRIGRLDPLTGRIELFETPLPAPRELRFDGLGQLWIAGMNAARVARFDPATTIFTTWTIPTVPADTDGIAALGVDPVTNAVWIASANADTVMRLEPGSDRFTVFPLPERGTVLHAITVDGTGTVWAASTTTPTWLGAPAALFRIEPTAVSR
jgi:streptogramin lyase